MTDVEEDIDSRIMNFDYINHSQSVSTLMLSSVHPSENSRAKFASGPYLGTRSSSLNHYPLKIQVAFHDS